MGRLCETLWVARPSPQVRLSSWRLYAGDRVRQGGALSWLFKKWTKAGSFAMNLYTKEELWMLICKNIDHIGDWDWIDKSSVKLQRDQRTPYQSHATERCAIPQLAWWRADLEDIFSDGWATDWPPRFLIIRSLSAEWMIEIQQRPDRRPVRSAKLHRAGIVEIEAIAWTVSPLAVRIWQGAPREGSSDTAGHIIISN